MQLMSSDRGSMFMADSSAVFPLGPQCFIISRNLRPVTGCFDSHNRGPIKRTHTPCSGHHTICAGRRGVGNLIRDAITTLRVYQLACEQGRRRHHCRRQSATAMPCPSALPARNFSPIFHLFLYPPYSFRHLSKESMGKPLTGFDHWPAITSNRSEAEGSPLRKELVLGRSSWDFDAEYTNSMVRRGSARGGFIADGWKILLGERQEYHSVREEAGKATTISLLYETRECYYERRKKSLCNVLYIERSTLQDTMCVRNNPRTTS